MKRTVAISTPLRAPLERAAQVLAEEPGEILSGRCSREDRAGRRFAAVVALDVGGGATVDQDITVEVGLARHDDDGRCTLALRWTATGHERWLPSFEGELAVSNRGRRTELALRGTYTVPFGALGRFGDGLAGRRIARRSLTLFVEGLADRIDSTVDRRMESPSWRPAPYPVSVRDDRAGSEHFIG